LISNLPLVLIVMPGSGAIIKYLKTGANLVVPFIFIGLSLTIRAILRLAVRFSVEKSLPHSAEFDRAKIVLGINAEAILVLGIRFSLFGKA
jgi:hypothetical protein